MKFRLTQILSAALVCLALTWTAPVAAQVDPLAPKTVYATGGTDVGATICWAVISANGKNSAAPVVTYLNATCDNATNTVIFYTAGATPAVCLTTNTTVTIPVNRTNGFAATDVVVVRHILTDTYEKLILDTLTISTNLVTTVAAATAVVPGDLIYKMTKSGFIPVGNATKELNGNGIWAGQPGLPLLLEATGAAACQVNGVAASYPQ